MHIEVDFMSAKIEPFFDPATSTYSYVVADNSTNCAAIIDSVLDYDPASGRLSTESADQLIDYVKEHKLTVQWILETHVHADHLSAASYLKTHLGGKTAIGSQVSQVQKTFGTLFNAEAGFTCDGSQFDHLLQDNEVIHIGDQACQVWHTPGHTPACVTYVIDGAAFVGDTIFMPDFGTARTDFPGGDAGTLYRSVKRILSLPEDTDLYMCHDYETDDRADFCHLTTVQEERASNIHIADGVSESEFIKFREARDKMLAAPRLLLPSVQFNMRAGHLAPAEANGQHYMKIPVRLNEQLTACLTSTPEERAA
jgi:glyoxylase-like metal-dependent hydrolase (beta-lactamase superfamily II)